MWPFNIKSRDLETRRDLVVRRLIAYLIETQPCHEGVCGTAWGFGVLLVGDLGVLHYTWRARQISSHVYIIFADENSTLHLVAYVVLEFKWKMRSCQLIGNLNRTIDLWRETPSENLPPHENIFVELAKRSETPKVATIGWDCGLSDIWHQTIIQICTE